MQVSPTHTPHNTHCHWTNCVPPFYWNITQMSW